MDAANPRHFDVGRGRWPGNHGDGERDLCGDGGEGFGDGLDHLIAADDADMVVGQQREGAAALRSGVDEDDGAGRRDGDLTRSEDGLRVVDFGGGEVAAGISAAVSIWTISVS